MPRTVLISLPSEPNGNEPLSERVSTHNPHAHAVAKPLFRNDINIAEMTWKKGYQSGTLSHPESLMIHLHLQGKMSVILDSAHVQLKPMDLVVVPPGMEFELSGSGNSWAQWACFHIADSLRWENLIECGPLITPYDYGPMIYFLLRNILDSHKNSEAYARGLALGDSWMLTRTLKRIAILNPPRKKTKALHTLTKEIISRPNYDWVVENMSRRLHVSRNTLFRMFKKEYGLSPKQFIIRTRMNAAANTLISTDAPLHFIARNVGYLNVYTFTRIFSQFHGCPPGAYRKKFISESR